MTTKQAISLTKLIDKLAGDTVFSVKFTKRSTGELRELTCRRGTYNKTSGTGGAYNAAEKGLLPVWSMKDKGWRTIPLEGIQEIQIRGIRYNAQGERIG